MSDDNHDKVDSLKHFMDYYGRYHDHKERMAWVATAFYVAGVVYITHAARHLACSSCPWQVAFSVLLTLTGILAFAFVWWQFQRRSEGGNRVEDCYKKLLKAYNDCPIYGEKLDWPFRSTADSRYTELISYIAIIGVTIMAVVVLNICT